VVNNATASFTAVCTGGLWEFRFRDFSQKNAILHKFSASIVRMAIYVVLKIRQKSDIGNSKKWHRKKTHFWHLFPVENYTTDFGFPQILMGYTYWLQKSRGIFL